MTEYIQGIVRAQVAEHLHVQRQVELQKMRRAAQEPRMNKVMLVASPLGKPAQAQGVASHHAGRSMTLAPGNPPAPPQQEPDLWMGALAIVLGSAVLLSALQSIWE